MANEVLGRITCPHCGHLATVHQQVGRNRAFYYRCYGGPNGDCGTIQCTSKGGQKFILDNAQWKEGCDPKPKAEPSPAAPPKAEQPPKAETEPKRGFLSALFQEAEA